MNTELAKELVKTRKSVKEKYQSLKSDIAQTQSQLEREYRPITEPLQKLLSTIKTDIPIKQEYSKIKHETSFSTPKISPLKRSPVNIYDKYLPSLPMNTPSFLEDTFQYTPPINEEQNSSDLINEEVERSRLFLQDLSKEPGYGEYLDSYDPLPRQYIDISIRGDEKDNDRQYGIKHDLELEKLKIGDSELQIAGKDVKVKDITYTGTPGLYELLFKKQPIGYKQTDLDNYMDILKRSNAYRRNFNPNEQIQGSQNEKYRTVIKPYLVKKGIMKSTTSTLPFSKPAPPARQLRRTQSLKHSTKGGLLKLSNKPIDFVYYDNPNELVNRLRLLVASQMAGNDGHNNEIVSILEELREAKIIK